MITEYKKAYQYKYVNKNDKGQYFEFNILAANQSNAFKKLHKLNLLAQYGVNEQDYILGIKELIIW